MLKKFPCTASALALAVSSAFAQSGSDSKYQLAYLDPVVVTASRYGELQSTASAPVDVISRKEIESSGASNLIEFLDAVPGVTVSRLYGRLGIDATVDIGFFGADSGAQNVLVLVDGQRLNPFDSGSIIWSQIPASAIDRVEIRRANGGVLYGDRAQGGVINIITRRDNTAEAGVALGSFGYRKADAYIGFRSDQVFGNVAALVAHTDGYRDYSSANQSSGQAMIGTDTSIGIFTVSGRTFTEDAKQPGALTVAQFNSNPRQKSSSSTGTTDRNGQSFSFRYESKDATSNGLVLDLFDSSVRRQSTSSGFSPTDIENKRTSFSPEYRLTVGSNRLILGGEFFRASANTKDDKQVAQDSAAIYMQNSYKFEMGPVLDIGARQQLIENQFQPTSVSTKTTATFRRNAASLGLRIPVSSSTILRAGVMSGFRFANADDLYYYDSNTFDPYKVNPNLKPSTSQEAYAEVRYQKTNLQLGGQVRSIRTKDEIGYKGGCLTESGTPYDCNANLYDTQRNIYTLTIKWLPTKSFRVTTSFDFVDANIDSGTDVGKRIPLTPKSIFRLMAEQKFNDWSVLLSMNNRGSMYSGSDSNNLKSMMPVRTVFDVGVQSSDTKSKWVWSIWVRNLTDKSYYDYTSYYTSVYPADGRAGEISLRYKF